jgi:hypothetical protein
VAMKLSGSAMASSLPSRACGEGFGTGEAVGEDRLAPLGRSVLQAGASGGVYARTAAFEAVVEALAGLITQHREPGTEVLRFPPVMSRREIERSGYLHSFPHLLGCVCGLHGEEVEIHAAVARSNAGQDWADALKASNSHFENLLWRLGWRMNECQGCQQILPRGKNEEHSD